MNAIEYALETEINRRKKIGNSYKTNKLVQKYIYYMMQEYVVKSHISIKN